MWTPHIHRWHECTEWIDTYPQAGSHYVYYKFCRCGAEKDKQLTQ